MNRSEFLAGVRAQLPILLGVAPFGMIYGVLAVGAGLPSSAAQAMSSVVFAGSSQFIGANLFAASAPFLVIVVTTFVVNLRHALYSASIAPYLERLPLRWKLLFAYLLTDEAYAVAILHYRRDSPLPAGEESRVRGKSPHSYYLGTALALWTTWQLSTAIGIFFGAQVPASWALDFALPLTFIAIVIPALADRPAIVSAVVGATVAVAAYEWPYKLGLMAAALAGIVAGLVAEQLSLTTGPKSG
ncbi:MAG TPA: AzlC family ABC transporter permease [Anaerolineales bacterium]|nr:AzlC family ABC transporter permease [Anaerolineales bacterium]